MICCEALGLPGAAESIQSWFKGNQVPEKSGQRIFHAADQILKAGQNTSIRTHRSVGNVLGRVVSNP
jgi:hypothetical protein